MQYGETDKMKGYRIGTVNGKEIMHLALTRLFVNRKHVIKQKTLKLDGKRTLTDTEHRKISKYCRLCLIEPIHGRYWKYMTKCMPPSARSSATLCQPKITEKSF